MNTSFEGVMERRRTMVSGLLLRGLTQREIQTALAGKGGIRNGDNKPWSIATVNRDVQAVKLAWQREYASDYNTHVARMMAEYREIRRQAWRDKALDIVLKCCILECKLLGLDRPDRLEIEWRKEAQDAGYDAAAVFEDLVQQAAAVLDEAGC